MFLGIYLAKYSETLSFPFQQVEDNKFQIFSQELIFTLFWESFSILSRYEKGDLALGKFSSLYSV